MAAFSSFSSPPSSPSPYDAPPSYELSALHTASCPRTKTITELAKVLDEHRVALVRGPPSSGKTTLARLLQSYYVSREEPVVFLTGWPRKTVDPPIYLYEKCKEAGYDEVDYMTLQYSNITFIIDEAQQSYNDKALWRGLIKSQSGCQSGARICLFASYGNPVMGTPEKPGGPPVHFESEQRVSLLRYHASHGPHSNNLGLFYTVEEFEYVLLLWSAVNEVEIAPVARKVLYYVTGGHPGAVESLVAYILAYYHSEVENNSIKTITEKHLVDSLEDGPNLFASLQTTVFFQSFPTSQQLALTPAAATALRRIIQEGTIPCDLDDPGVELCFKRGWAHTDYTHSSPAGVENLVCFLPTRLHVK